MKHAALRRLVGMGAVVAPTLHSITDLLEVGGGGFSASQLGINYGAFVAMPFVVLGLYAMQRPQVGWLGILGSLAYGTAFVYFAGTTVFALVRETPDYVALLGELGDLYFAHGALMIIGGILFGIAVVRAQVLPPWTGVVLIAGVSLNLLVALLQMSPVVHVLGSAMRNVGFVGMGVALLRSSSATDELSA